MQRTLRNPFLMLLVACFLISCYTNKTQAASVLSEEQVTFYPTYGYQEGNHWVIPMRLWVHKRRGLTEKWIARITARVGTLERQEINNFRFRLVDFVADSESGEVVRLQFDSDPEHQTYRLQDHKGNFPKTDANGLIHGLIKVALSKAQTLLQQQDSQNGWLTFHATSSGHAGVGRVQLLAPSGLSVISDIDDTVKVTEMPAGPKVVVKNTFFHDFVAVPAMAEMYQAWTGAAFHYVSGGPWQLYRPLAAFLFSAQGGFPEGTFHMKNARKNLLHVGTWEDLTALISNEKNTFKQKIAAIREIMQRFPERTFILVGDSGEQDPEVYRQIKLEFPGQVQEIRIRDVVNDRERNPVRLQGMTIIPAPTIQRHVAQ